MENQNTTHALVIVEKRVQAAWSALMMRCGHAFGSIDTGYLPEVTEMREALAALASAPAGSVIAAVRGITDDYMTSEAHHPGYVLIPTERFDMLRAAEASLASAPAGEQEPIAWQWERRGRFGPAVGKWEKVWTPYRPDTWPEEDRRNIVPLYAAVAPAGDGDDEGEPAPWAVAAENAACDAYAQYMGLDEESDPTAGKRAAALAIERHATAALARPRAAVGEQSREAIEAECAALIAAYYRREIGRLMQQAEHWAENGKPLAVHHRVMKADNYFQIVCQMKRSPAKGWKLPFDEIRDALGRKPIKDPGTYPPSKDLYRYRDPAFVVAALRSPPAKVESECPSSPDGCHQVDTSMESGPNNCFHCEKPMPNGRTVR